MNKWKPAFLLALVMFFLVGAGGGVANADRLDEQVARVLKQTADRRNQMLQKQLKQTYPPKGKGGGGLWHHENFALAAYWLNEQTAQADDRILALQKDLYPAAVKSFHAGSFHWHAYLQQRIYFLFSSRSKHFPGRMSAKAEKAILEMLWAWSAPVCRKELASPKGGWWYWGSENHHMMAWVSFWGAAHIFKDHPDYKNRTYGDGSSPAEMARAFDEYFKAYARQRATKGLLAEVASPTYSKYTLNTWYNLVDFADDPVLKKRMGMLLDVYWADWAIEQIDGVRGGSRHRCYFGSASSQGSGGGQAAWYHFARGAKGSRHPGVMSAATTFWRPSRVVVELVIDTKGRGEYSYRSRRPGLKEPGKPMNYVKDPAHPLYIKKGVNCLNPQGGGMLRVSWCTPDFVAGMSQTAPLSRDDWTPISAQNRWNGVIFAGHQTARIYTQTLMPKRGSVYNAEWGVQNKGVMILQRLRASNARGQMVWFDKSLKRVEKDGWIFVEAPRAYGAVRVVRGGGEWKKDSAAQRRSGKGRDDQGQWFALKDEYSPVIIEVSRKKDHAGFPAFQTAILANELSLKGKIVKYHSRFYKTTLTLPTDASAMPLIDGTPVDFKAKAVYDSPYLQGAFGKGVVTIRKGKKVLTLDFSKNSRVVLGDDI